MHGGEPTTQEPWWRSAVVYQIYPRSFADANGDGVGDLRGIIDRVDHLARLGVDVVWLSPVYPSPQDDGGYDISDYEDVDPLFGTLADLDELIAALHERGMKLVMDLVVNHTAAAHRWFVASRDPHGDKRDWYWWRPPRAGMEPGHPGAEPTNWASFFSGPAWELDPASGEYYLHLFAWTSSTSSPRWSARTARCPTAPCWTAARTATAARGSSAAPGSTSSSPRCTARCSPGATRHC